MKKVDLPPMAKSVRKQHIKANGNDIYETGCLYCREPKNDTDLDSLEFGDLDMVECGDIEQKATCLKCGRKWIDVYSLTEVREIV